MNQFPTDDFAKVMNYPDDRNGFFVFDFTKGYDPEFVREKGWGIGRYNEKRSNMYVAPQFNNERNIHMGIDIWAEAGEAVFSFTEGKVAYMKDNNQQGDYGPTIIIKYNISGRTIYALYGHLSRASLEQVAVGEEVKKGQKIAEIGTKEVNGGWAPHLHFQLSVDDPGEADIPGVVSDDEREQALKLYPDPRLVLGELY
ncbi:MAG TPA: peptidoglycan DD-metalloendopeptidase family protein [Balneolaceae bacterium]